MTELRIPRKEIRERRVPIEPTLPPFHRAEIRAEEMFAAGEITAEQANRMIRAQQPSEEELRFEVETLTTTIQRLFPDLQWTKSLGMPLGTDLDIALKTLSQQANENPDQFIESITGEGRTPDTESLLRLFVEGSVHEDGTPYMPEEIDAVIEEFFVDIPVVEEEVVEGVVKPRETKFLENQWGEWLVKEVSTGLDRPYTIVNNADIEKYIREHPDIWEQVETWQREHPALTLADEVVILGQSLLMLPSQWGAAILQATQGFGGASVVDKDWADRFIEDANTRMDEFVSEVSQKYTDRPTILGIAPSDVASISRNIAYSLTSMGAGLVAGMPISLLPVPGARVAAWASGTAASGAVAYQMTTYQITQTYLELMNEEKIARTGVELTVEEENQLKDDFEVLARKYGLWEAIPEALSNLAFAKLLTTPLTKMFGRSIASRIIGKVSLIYGEELLTETITQKGQSDVEVEAGLREGRITWVEAFKEVAPQTFLLTTVMGGLGQVSVSSVNRIKASLKNEISEEHPLFNELNDNIVEDIIPTDVEPQLTVQPVTAEEVIPEFAPEVEPEVAPAPVTEPVVAPAVPEKVALVTPEVTPPVVEAPPVEPPLPAGLKKPIESLSTPELQRRVKTASPHVKLYQAELDKRIPPSVKKPLPTLTEPTTAEVAETQATIGKPKLTLKQVDALAGFFGEYLTNPTTETAWGLTRELRRETLAGRAEELKSRTQELIVQEGITTEEAIKRAIAETMAGELPSARTEYLQGLTNELRDALFAKVAYTLKDSPFEMMSTFDALTNALQGKPIPREPGVKGGSAYSRLQKVFGDQPRVLQAIDKAASEHKPLKDVIEGTYHEIGREPIPVDQTTADYLRGLSADVIYTPTVFREPTPVTRYDAPIDKVFKQPPMFNFMEQSTFNRVLKEIGMLPLDIGNLLRANKASFDNSFLRQSKLLLSGHPIVAWQAHVTSWQSMFSQKHTEAEWELITRDPDFQIYEQIRVDTGHDPLRVPAFAAVKGTEQYRTSEEFGFTRQDVERAIPKFTAWLPHVKYSERAFSAGTNKTVWRIWKQKLEWSRGYSEKIASGEVTLKEGEAFDIIQEMTDEQSMLGDLIQRANLRRFSGLAPATNAFFFAARSKIGRLLLPKHLIGFTLRDGKPGFNPRVMKEAWKDFFLWTGYISAIMFLGEWLDLWDLEKDPRNAEFMSARIGKTRIDPWAGQRQFAVLYARLVTRTGVSSVTGVEYDVNPVGALQNFVTNSLSPLASILLEFWTGRNFLGQVIEYDDAKYWIEKVTPFAINDVWEAGEEDWRMGVAVTIPAIYGEGIQTYTGDWEDNFSKMGLPKYIENTAYGLTEPIYDVKDFWSDTSSQFAGVDPETLTEAKGFPPYIKSIAEARVVNEHLRTLPNEKLYLINADPEKGATFADYYQMWRDREKIVASGDEKVLKEFDQDERTRSAYLGNFSQRQFALLNEYHLITDKTEQKEFVKEHPGIATSPRQDYLISHTNENALLAVWGQTDALTQAAYDETQSLVKGLDIPDNAIEEYLPAEKMAKTHFAYLETGAEFGWNSWEAQLVKAKDPDYSEWAGLDIPESPPEALELKIKHHDLYDEYDELETDEARAKLKADNPEWVDDMRRVEALENNGADFAEAWVERGRIVDEFEAGSSKAKVWLVDNKDAWDWALGQELLTDDGSDWNIPVLRINAQWRTQDEEYDALPVEGDDRDDYLADNEDYRKDRRRRNVYRLEDPEGVKFPDTQVENYVTYYELTEKGMRRERMLIEDAAFGKAMHDIAGLDLPDKVPAVQYDDIYDQYQADFEKWEGLADFKSEHYVEDEDVRQFARDGMKFKDGKLTEFGTGMIRRDAYYKYVPENHIENYVGYYSIISEGKPDDWLEGEVWYEDDWFMIEHLDFYREVYRELFNLEKYNFITTPTRAAWDRYVIYKEDYVKGKPRTDYRWELWESGFTELEEWFVAKDMVHIVEKRRRAKLTRAERFAEEAARREAEFEAIFED